MGFSGPMSVSYTHLIDSILAQTFTDFELILVDDGSPDNCPALCDAAAEKDSRVRVIHQQNKGLSGARNAGINVARGNWLGFVDSDDMIDPTFCEKMLHAAVQAGDVYKRQGRACAASTARTLSCCWTTSPQRCLQVRDSSAAWC